MNGTGAVTVPPSRLFVLGAGFSAPAGLPLGPALLCGVRDHVRGHFRKRGAWDGPLEREICEWQRLYPGEVLDLERVLAYSHRRHYLRLIGSEEYFGHGSRTIDAARRAIQELLINATPKVPPALYLDFGRRLRPNDVIVTFNYDTLLEKALDALRLAYTLTPEWWLEDQLLEAPYARYVDVLKLHGSVDWYDRQYHDEARAWHAQQGHDVPDRDPLFGESPVIPTECLANGLVNDYGGEILRRVFRVPNHEAHHPISWTGGSVVPFILPPAYDKLLGYAPILDLWENLYSGTGFVSAVIVIGYSMPPHDSHAYEALGHLLVMHQLGGDSTRGGHRKVPLQIVTLAESENTARSFYPFLDHSRTRVWHRGFSRDALEWLNWGDGTT